MIAQKKMILGMIIISAFVFIVAVSSLYVEMQIMSGNACGCAIPIWLFIPLLASLGLFIGGLVYYFFKPISFAGYQEAGKQKLDKGALLKFLPEEEARIFSVIIDNNGRALQSEIVRKTGLGKVKVHRLLKKMEGKGILKKERNKKVFVVMLSDDILKLFGV